VTGWTAAGASVGGGGGGERCVVVFVTDDGDGGAGWCSDGFPRHCSSAALAAVSTASVATDR
jgi:hypothetical protein